MPGTAPLIEMNDLNIEDPLRMRLLRWVHMTAEELEDHFQPDVSVFS
jgi:hypothetical protein